VWLSVLASPYAREFSESYEASSFPILVVVTLSGIMVDPCSSAYDLQGLYNLQASHLISTVLGRSEVCFELVDR